VNGEKSQEDSSVGRQISWRTAAEIKDRRPQWAWEYEGYGRLMQDTLVLFAGRPDAGKSTAARFFAAGYTNGTIDGCFLGEPQNVAYIAAEESLEVMVKPSLRAVGADMTRIHFPEVQINGQQARLLSNVDEQALTADFLQRGITVVIVDPVMASIGSAVDINRNNETREFLEPWARMAEAINGLVIGIVHLVKAPGGDIVAAINGSSAFGEVARAIIAFARDPQPDDNECVLSQE
jgi:RecA-family ATPase